MTAARFLDRAGLAALCLAALATAADAQQATAQRCRFVDHWVWMESRGDPAAANPNSTAIGRWQMTQAAFEDVGLIRRVSATTSEHFGGNDWTNVVWNDNPFGIRSLEDLRNNPQAQDHYGRLYHRRNWAALEQRGIASHVGRSFQGVQLNESALLTCAGYLGASGCARFLETGQSEHAAHALWRMAQASACDASDIAGSDTPVDIAANIARTPAPGLYCEPGVLQRLETLAAARLNAETALAGNDLSGYRTADGRGAVRVAGFDLRQFGVSSIVAPTDAGLPGPGVDLGTRALSCLDRLLGGVAIVFAPPALPDILRMLTDFVCREAERRLREATTPLDAAFFRDFGVGGISVPVRVGVHATREPGVRISSRTVDIFNHGTTGPLHGGRDAWQPLFAGAAGGGILAASPSTPSRPSGGIFAR